jgi:hypothetical protein
VLTGSASTGAFALARIITPSPSAGEVHDKSAVVCVILLKIGVVAKAIGGVQPEAITIEPFIDKPLSLAAAELEKYPQILQQ